MIDPAPVYRRLWLRRLWTAAILFSALLPACAVNFRHLRHRQNHPLIVAYFGQWGLYQSPPLSLKELESNGALGLLDQINYAQGSVRGGRCTIADPRADLETVYSQETSVSGKADDPRSPFRGYFHQFEEVRRRYPKMKLLISLEGSAQDFEADAQPEQRRAFVASCVDLFLRGRFGPGIHKSGLFDGIDVDWEYPQAKDAGNFRALLEEFRRQMDAVRPGLRLAIAVGDHPQMTPGTDFGDIARIVDQVGIMNYDYAGPWESTTGLVAPLFRPSNAPRGHGSIAASLEAYENAGVPPEKTLMGLPFYGYRWSGVNPANHGLFQPGRGVAEDKPYRYIRELTGPYAFFREPETQAPWLFDGTNFWTFEDPISIEYKVSYAMQQRLAGVMIWEIGQDTEEATLLNVIWQSVRHPLDIGLAAEDGSLQDAGQAGAPSAGQPRPGP